MANGNIFLDGLYRIASASKDIKDKAKAYLLEIIGPITSTGGLTDAPSDGTEYLRKDAAWVNPTAGAGDMLASVYDPTSVIGDAFDYTNFTNTPTIPTSVDDLGPSQTGNSGKFLTTDGTNASWGMPSTTVPYTWIVDLRIGGYNYGNSTYLLLTGSYAQTDWNDTNFPRDLRYCPLLTSSATGNEHTFTFYHPKTMTARIYFDVSTNFNLSSFQVYSGGLIGNVIDCYSASPGGKWNQDTGVDKSLTAGTNSVTIRTVTARGYLGIKRMIFIGNI